MKIKEVSEKTGLTDRAIRLYISEGLAMPAIEESYSGRKNIEFSEQDVERLNNVAMLRKAGFSITDIKNIIDKKETEIIIEKYIEETTNEIEHKNEIVEKLKNISFDEEVTIETICARLSVTVEKTEVPAKDMKLTVSEIVRKTASIIFALVVFVYSLTFLIVVCMIMFDFKYIRFDYSSADALFVHACWLIPIMVALKILHMNSGKRFLKNGRGKRQGKTAALVVVTIIGCALLTPVSFFLGVFVSPFYSQTTDIDNYLEFDDNLESEFDNIYGDSSIYKVFPRTIPRTAQITSINPYNSAVPETTHYYYRYSTCPDSNYGTYEISAEWILDSVEYEKAKENLPGDVVLEESLIALSQAENNEKVKTYLSEQLKLRSSYKVVTQGNWTIVFYRNDEEYNCLIAAYNDTEKKMRYIASDYCGHEPLPETPYYQTFDWK